MNGAIHAAPVLLIAAAAAWGRDIPVREAAGLREALAAARPGDRILIEPGEYPGNIYAAGLRGEEGRPIVIAGKDPGNPPLIRGGANGLHLAGPRHVELRDLSFKGATANGINIDDGGKLTDPARSVRLVRVRISEVGPRGNRDGLKMSGVSGFRIEECRIERWGVGGSAIDMVGCHDGVIEGCVFRHTDASDGNGVQTKGGTSSIVIRRCRFEDAGERGVNIGGSTGLAFFRPPLPEERGPDTRLWEAKDIVVEGNTFVGCGAPVAFVGCTGCAVRSNTIYRPRRWTVRILQETTAPGFAPCRGGEFSRNLVAFRSDEIRETVNVGRGTDPDTFRFSKNFWFCLDRPDRSRPTLPAKETGGTYGEDPLFKDPAAGDLTLLEGSPARQVGAGAPPPADGR